MSVRDSRFVPVVLATALAAVLAAAGPANAGATSVAGPGVKAAPAHSRPEGDLVTTVDFEGYPVGTEITDQYAGITFEYATAAGFNLGTPANGVASSDSGGPPLVVASGAHSGSNAGELPAPGEFASAGTFAALSNLADSVSVYIGDLNDASVHVELDAYDADRDRLGSDTAVTSAVGAQTLLTYSTGGTAAIAYVAIYRSDHIGGDAVIDDLSFDVPPSTAPVVGVSAPTITYELGQGGTRAIPLTVARLDNATSPVTIDVTGLPSGVTSSLSENPVPLPDTVSTLTLSASSTAAVGNYTLTLSASASGATAQSPDAVTLSIIAPVQVVAPASIQVGGCSSHQATIVAQVAPGLTGPVSFAVGTTSSSPGLSVSVSPVQAPVSDSTAQTALTVSSTGGSDPGTVQLVATLPGGGSQDVDIPVQRLGPEVTAIDAMDSSSQGTPVAGLLAKTPRAGRAGTTVEIFGQYFCSSATVAFGNPEATATVSVARTLGAQGPEDYIRVTTPRDATSGPVTVTAGSPQASGSSSSSLTVDSYRNAEAFNFHNFYPDITFQDMTDAFGPQQTYINVNVCGAFTFGLVNCSAAIVPDPVAEVWYGIAQAALAGGTCFGISLTDQRLVSGQMGVNSFPRSGPAIYDLEGPPVTADGYAYGGGPLLAELKAQHVMQFSTEFIKQYSTASLDQLMEGPGQAVAQIAEEINGIFAAGRYPMIELNDGNGGGGHVVVAYDMVATGSGGYDIYVYDSNNPYRSGEDSDGNAHAGAVASSVVHLFSNGTWSLASTTEKDGAPFQGGQSAIVVTDPASIPLHPTLGTLGGLAPGLLFSSAGGPGSAGAGAPGAARLVQLSGAGGKTLYRQNGSLNTDAATRLDAVPFAPFVSSGAGATRSPQLTIVGPGVKQLMVTTRGSAPGATAETFVDGGFAGTVAASVPKGGTGQTSFSSGAGTVGFSGATSAPLSLTVDRVTAGGSESVEVTTSATKAGSDMLALGAGGAVTLARRGSATTFMVALAGELANGLPASFTSGPVPIGPGQTASISGIHWGSLATTSLTVQVGGKAMKLRNRAHAARLVKLVQVKELARSHQHVSVVVSGSLAKLAGGSDIAIVWVVRHGKRVLARHEVALEARQGAFSSSWTLRLAKARGITVTAGVVAVGTEAATVLSSTATRSLTFSVN
jgi:hypothetical protein